MDPVGPPSLLAASIGHRIFIDIRAKYGIQKNIYICDYNLGSGNLAQLTMSAKIVGTVHSR